MSDAKSTVVALVPPLPKGCELSAEHRDQLRASGLNDVTIGASQVYTETSATKLAEIVRWSKWSLGSALVLPFFVPGRSEPVMYRVKPARPLTETKNGKTKARKYEQPKGVDVMPFFPPNARRTTWYRDLGKPVLWTEGEKKSLLLDQLGYATVGGTGITCFHAKREEKDDPFVLNALIREHVSLAGREHRIVFDSDASEKSEIMHAARRLAGMVEAAGAGRVVFVRIPHAPDGSKLGIDDFFALHGEEATRALLEQGEPIVGLPPEEVYEPLSSVRAFKGADLPKKLRMPWGYSVDRLGCVWKKADRHEGEDKLIAKAPIVVRRIVLDLYTGEERVELAFQRRGVWKTLLIGREDMLSSRHIVPAVASHGAPVETGSAAGIVTWLSDLELANDKRLPRTTCVSSCGWHTLDGQMVFMAPGLADVEGLVFDDRAGKSAVRGLGAKGDAAVHLAALRGIIEQSTPAAVAVFGALASPLLERLDAPNFAVHLHGDSSRGKSTMLRAGASVFGDPYDHAWVASWNSTSVGHEFRANTLSGLPFCADESGVTDERERSKAIYMLINGTGRARGQKDGGLRQMLSWHTVVISTGEPQLVADDANTGAQIRVLQCPVDGIGEWGAEEVDAFNATVREHHGHIGSVWLQRLSEIPDEQWDVLRKGTRELAREIAALGDGSGIRARQAAYIATLMMTERLAFKLLGLGDELGALTCALADQELQDTPEVESAAERAFGEVSGWLAASLRTGFARMNGSDVHDSHVRHETLGWYQDDGDRPDRDRRLWVLPRALKQVLKEHGHDLSVLREWRQRGWIDAEPKRYDRSQRVGGRLTRVVCLDPDTFWGPFVPTKSGYSDE